MGPTCDWLFGACLLNSIAVSRAKQERDKKGSPLLTVNRQFYLSRFYVITAVACATLYVSQGMNIQLVADLFARNVLL